ncbi:MAG: transcriptional regulator NrdR [Pseudomonadota bacterium]
MKCPFCGHDDTNVKDSRSAQDGTATRRRRECPSCGQRFTTFERVQMRELTVTKSGGRKQPFDRDKIIKSMQIALRKRPVELSDIEATAARIVTKLETGGDAEIPSKDIGKHVMEEIAKLDTIGYIRYASVYKDFRDPEDFNDFLSKAEKLKEAS